MAVVQRHALRLLHRGIDVGQARPAGIADVHLPQAPGGHVGRGLAGVTDDHRLPRDPRLLVPDPGLEEAGRRGVAFGGEAVEPLVAGCRIHQGPIPWGGEGLGRADARPAGRREALAHQVVVLSHCLVMVPLSRHGARDRHPRRQRVQLAAPQPSGEARSVGVAGAVPAARVDVVGALQPGGCLGAPRGHVHVIAALIHLGGLPASLVEASHVQRAEGAGVEFHRVQLAAEMAQVVLGRRRVPRQLTRPPPGGEGVAAHARRRGQLEGAQRGPVPSRRGVPVASLNLESDVAAECRLQRERVGPPCRGVGWAFIDELVLVAHAPLLLPGLAGQRDLLQCGASQGLGAGASAHVEALRIGRAQSSELIRLGAGLTVDVDRVGLPVEDAGHVLPRPRRQHRVRGEAVQRRAVAEARHQPVPLDDLQEGVLALSCVIGRAADDGIELGGSLLPILRFDADPGGLGEGRALVIQR